ncbi:MAG: VOC family protein [Hyphomonadaceae bacterium]
MPTQSAIQSPSARPGRLIFMKLVVMDLIAMMAFYNRVFGLIKTQTIENDEILEVVLQRSEDDRGPSLVLYTYKDGRKVSPGTAHGAVGFTVDDVDKVYAEAIAAGATSLFEPFESPGVRVALFNDPEGHEIELLRFARPG